MHTVPVSQRLAVCRIVLLTVEALGLLNEEEGVTVGPAGGRRGRTNVISDEGLARSQGVLRSGLKMGWIH